MKARILADPSGQVPAPPEKRFLISQGSVMVDWLKAIARRWPFVFRARELLAVTGRTAYRSALVALRPRRGVAFERLWEKHAVFP